MTYQALHQDLLSLKQLLTEAATESPIETHDAQTWQHQITQAEQSFQAALTLVQVEQLESQGQQRLQALQTEISRQLRLVKLDISFLQAARQPGVQQQRYQQTQAHLGDLLRLTAGIVALLESKTHAD
ncbi:MAG: heterocyst frequency control protein PatD [Cyanobacteria bacterium P01_H01_bin.121]